MPIAAFGQQVRDRPMRICQNRTDRESDCDGVTVPSSLTKGCTVAVADRWCSIRMAVAVPKRPLVPRHVAQARPTTTGQKANLA